MTTTPDIPIARPVDPGRVGGIYLFYLLCLLLVVVVGSAMLLLWLPLGLLGSELLLILLPAVWYVRRRRLPLADALRWRSVPAGLWLRGLMLGVTGWAVAALIAALTISLVSHLIGKHHAAGFLAQQMPTSPLALVGFLVAVAVLPGICEETLFRGVIQGTLERKGNRRAILYTALLFAAFHLDPWQFVSLFLLGVLLGLIAVRTGSLLPAMVSHTCNNATAFLVAAAARPAPRTTHVDKTATMAAGLFVIAMALLFIPVLLEFLRYTRNRPVRPTLLAAVPAGLSWREIPSSAPPPAPLADAAASNDLPPLADTQPAPSHADGDTTPEP